MGHSKNRWAWGSTNQGSAWAATLALLMQILCSHPWDRGIVSPREWDWDVGTKGTQKRRLGKR